jgi:hypothetical protein
MFAFYFGSRKAEGDYPPSLSCAKGAGEGGRARIDRWRNGAERWVAVCRGPADVLEADVLKADVLERELKR